MNKLTKRDTPIVQLRNYLLQRSGEFKTALPQHIEPDRFIRVIITAVSGNPDLLACDRATLWNACLRCAADGLMPDGDEAALVPFKSRCVYIPMYQGLLKKFRNSGQFRHINTGIVYEGEEFSHWIDENGEHFRHVPGDDRNEKKIRRVYATATTKDGAFFCADLSMSEVLKHEKMSRTTRDDAPWKQWRPEMMRKTAIRVLSKLLPRSSDLDSMIRNDEWDQIEDRNQEIARPADAHAALDQFGADGVSDETQEVPEEGGAVASAPADASAVQSVAQVSLKPSDRPATSSVELAYAEGKKDRLRGTENAPPAKYAGELAAAWSRGWIDGHKK